MGAQLQLDGTVLGFEPLPDLDREFREFAAEARRQFRSAYEILEGEERLERNVMAPVDGNVFAEPGEGILRSEDLEEIGKLQDYRNGMEVLADEKEQQLGRIKVVRTDGFSHIHVFEWAETCRSGPEIYFTAGGYPAKESWSELEGELDIVYDALEAEGLETRELGSPGLDREELETSYPWR